ncbi:hypothetical protein D3C80_1736410 [compost metagenome]
MVRLFRPKRIEDIIVILPGGIVAATQSEHPVVPLDLVLGIKPQLANSVVPASPEGRSCIVAIDRVNHVYRRVAKSIVSRVVVLEPLIVHPNNCVVL